MPRRFNPGFLGQNPGVLQKIVGHNKLLRHNYYLQCVLFIQLTDAWLFSGSGNTLENGADASCWDSALRSARHHTFHAAPRRARDGRRGVSPTFAVLVPARLSQLSGCILSPSIPASIPSFIFSHEIIRTHYLVILDNRRPTQNGLVKK